jgi:hypothetical protein
MFRDRNAMRSDQSEMSHLPSVRNNISIIKQTHLFTNTKNNSKRSIRGSQIQDPGFSDDTSEECVGWKLVEANFKDGMVCCKVPEVNIENGQLIMFERQGVMEMIKSNDFNSAGKQLLDEVTEWLNKKTQKEHLTEREGDSTIKDIKKMFDKGSKDKVNIQKDKNKEMFGFDLSLNYKESIDEKVVELEGKFKHLNTYLLLTLFLTSNKSRKWRTKKIKKINLRIL